MNITSASGTQATMSPDVWPAPRCISLTSRLPSHSDISVSNAMFGQVNRECSRRPGRDAGSAIFGNPRSCLPRSAIRRRVSSEDNALRIVGGGAERTA